MTVSFLICVLLPVTYYLSTVSAQTYSFRQNATGPSSVCEGSDVTLQCVIIFTSASDVVTVQTTIWSRNEMAVIETVNSSGTFYIPNHSQPNDPDTGLPSNDLVITNVRLEDDNTNYTCTATGSGITSSVVLNVIGIPAIDNLNVIDGCTSVTVTWDSSEGPCGDLSYDVTLSSSDGVIRSFTTSDTASTFNRTDETISVNIFAFNENEIRGDVAVINVSPNDYPNATNIRNSSTCVTSFDISWDISNNRIACGVVYDVSISPPPIGSEQTIITINSTFYSVIGLNNSLPDVTVTVTARNEAGQGVIMHDVQLPKPLEPPSVENLTAIRSTDDITISWDTPNIDNCTTLPITCYTIEANFTLGNDDIIHTCMWNVMDNNQNKFEVSYNECFDVNFMDSANYHNISVSSTCDINENTIKISVKVTDNDSPLLSNKDIITIGVCGGFFLYILLILPIYCIIKIIKEDANSLVEYREPGCCVLVTFGIMSLGIAPLIHFIWKMYCKEEKCCAKECCCSTKIVFVEYLFLVLSLGIGYLMWKIYNMECWCCKGRNSKGSLVQPGMSMEEKQSDLYASPGMKQEHTDIDEPKTAQEQALYSYARTGPVNVVIPGQGSQQQQPEPAGSEKKQKKKYSSLHSV